MKALLLKEPKNIFVQDVSLRELQADEVLIKVKACGVCGTDIHIYEGHEGATDNILPLIMGHEFSGIVEKVGSDVVDFKIGDRVCVDPNYYCGECYQCKCGNVHFCLNPKAYGVLQFGGFAEYSIANKKVVYKVPNEVGFDEAALIEMIACCLHGIDRTHIQLGDTVAITGFGSVGQTMMQLAKLAGAARIIVVEPNEQKRKQALTMGSCLAIDPISENAVQKIADASIQTVHRVIDCTGNIRAMENSMEIASRGATVMLFGLASTGEKMSILPFDHVFRKELTVTSSFVNPLCTQRVIDLLASKVLDVQSIITDRFLLDDAVQIFTDDSFRTHGKILVLPNGEL